MVTNLLAKFLSGKFPHRYANPDGVVYPFCSSGSKAEYPLMSIPPGPYKSGDPGPDRAIYLVGTRKIFCGPSCLLPSIWGLINLIVEYNRVYDVGGVPKERRRLCFVREF